jgi:hypothetical protein
MQDRGRGGPGAEQGSDQLPPLAAGW